MNRLILVTTVWWKLWGYFLWWCWLLGTSRFRSESEFKRILMISHWLYLSVISPHRFVGLSSIILCSNVLLGAWDNCIINLFVCSSHIYFNGRTIIWRNHLVFDKYSIFLLCSTKNWTFLVNKCLIGLMHRSYPSEHYVSACSLGWYKYVWNTCSMHCPIEQLIRSAILLDYSL